MRNISYLTTGQKIRFIRQCAGVSLRELARRLDLTPQAISFYETDQNDITITRIEQIETALGFRRGFITHPDTEAVLLHFWKWTTNDTN